MFGGKAEELIIVLLIILLLFGAKKIPELSRSIGQSVKEIRKGFTEDDEPKSSDSASKSDTKKKS